MLVWRIAREIHCDTTLEGIGGLLVAGRWHRRGHPILYTSSSAALAALEVLVHLEPLQAPDDLRLLGLELPDDLAIETLDLTQLPNDWRSLPAPESTQSIGSAWLERRSSVALRVPSVIVAMESNVLL
ncbi:MAG: RES family NAD+ phosphorylase, partial [Cyanobacteriota bacterium]